ncbi:MAG: SigE family RNA polymerase sigma factor [Acidimicrobiales bacterium]
MTSGRDEAVAALFDTHYAGLCRLAAMLLGDRAQAEEVVQEAFLDTFAGWRRIRRPEAAGAYLRTAVVNRCRSRSRRRMTEERGNRTVWATDGQVDPVSEPERRAETLAVWRAVQDLPDRQREAVVLRYYADLTEAQVAAALSCSVGTVKSQLFKARASLGRRLEERPEESPDQESGCLETRLAAPHAGLDGGRVAPRPGERGRPGG